MLNIPVLDDYETYEGKKDAVLKFCKQYAYANNLLSISNYHGVEDILVTTIIAQQFIIYVECKDVIQKHKSLDNTSIVISALRSMKDEMEHIKIKTEEDKEIVKMYNVFKFIGEYIMNNI